MKEVDESSSSDSNHDTSMNKGSFNFRNWESSSEEGGDNYESIKNVLKSKKTRYTIKDN